MPDAAERQDGHADHLPAGGAERERRLLVELRGLQEDLAAERGDDRQDHDGQHDADGEDRAAGARDRAIPEPGSADVGREQRDPAGVRGEPGVDRLDRGGEDSAAPEAEDDRGHRREQVDDVAEALREPARRVVRDEEGDADRERDGDDQGDRRGPDGAEDEGADVGPEAVGLALDLGRIDDEGRDALGDEEDRDGRQDDEDEAAGEGGAAAEDAVGGTLLGA